MYEHDDNIISLTANNPINFNDDPIIITVSIKLKDFHMSDHSLATQIIEYCKESNFVETPIDYGILGIYSNIRGLKLCKLDIDIKDKCFNSCIEFLIRRRTGKDYKPKLFPQTGKIQIAGCTENDLSDCDECIEYILDLLRKIGYNLEIEEKVKSLVNYKYDLNFTSDRMVVNIPHLATFLNVSKKKLYVCWTYSNAKIKIHYGGHINVSVSNDNIREIFDYLWSLFKDNWKYLIGIIPRTDRDERYHQIYMKMLNETNVHNFSEDDGTEHKDS